MTSLLVQPNEDLSEYNVSMEQAHGGYYISPTLLYYVANCTNYNNSIN